MKTQFILLLLCMSSFGVGAQTVSKSVVGSGGAPLADGTMFINVTIGEAVVGTVENDQTLDQGFWTAFAGDEILSTQDVFSSEESIQLYPNPVVDEMYVNFGTTMTHALQLQLFDISGNHIMGTEIDPLQQSSHIDLSHVASGVYLVVMSSAEINFQKSFKIIKN